MSTFGKKTGGGRRTARREEVTTAAVVTTVQNSRSACLLDLSSSGARLGGKDLPTRGQSVALKIEKLRAFGLVVWTDDVECGVAFDAPVPHFEVERLKRDLQKSRLDQQGLQVKLAFDDWNSASCANLRGTSLAVG